MDNTVARRATSIALMAIMVAGGMTIPFPGTPPQAIAAPRRLANLGLSTTMFGCPNEGQILAKDPDIVCPGIEQGAPAGTLG